MLRKEITYKGCKFDVEVEEKDNIIRIRQAEASYPFLLYEGCMQQGDTLKEQVMNTIILYATDLVQIEEFEKWDGNMDNNDVLLSTLEQCKDKMENKIIEYINKNIEDVFNLLINKEEDK